jgi:uncharacterized protein (DUF1501 family)
MWTRRRFVAATAASWILAGLPRARGEAKKAPTKAPRYFVTFFLRGGMDAVYTFDPKTRADVEAKVDVPYAANDILDAGPLQFGPHFKPLTKWAKDMSVVRGIQVKTANHETGSFQMIRMRTRVSTNMPSLYDVLGQSRDTQPLGSVMLGEISSFEHSPGALAAPTGASDGKTSLDVLDELSDDDVAVLADVYARHLKRFPAWQQSPETERTREYVAQTAAFFERMKTTKRFKPEEWNDKKGKAGRATEDMQRTLWFLENDLARGVAVKVFFDWDSHYRNADKQTTANTDFTQILDRFLMELHTRKNQYGVLADQTVVVVGSELGRFPIINGNLGKDHFPETGLLFFGPGIQKGKSFSPTGKMMEGQKVSLDTGMPDANGTNLVLDDVGATMFHIAGLNPEPYGYVGRRLRFLEQA